MARGCKTRLRKSVAAISDEQRIAAGHPKIFTAFRIVRRTHQRLRNGFGYEALRKFWLQKSSRARLCHLPRQGAAIDEHFARCKNRCRTRANLFAAERIE